MFIIGFSFSDVRRLSVVLLFDYSHLRFVDPNPVLEDVLENRGGD